MTTHVFIVNEDTFKIHLNYMFVGTGKGAGEENLGMISDISGCRIGDKVIFYVTEVGFFGIFKIISDVFWDKSGDYLTGGHKKLTNRLLISPEIIYPKGISEWDALDNLDNLPNGRESPANTLIWSLIYRKLEAGRGCTPIFEYESEQLINLIKKANNHVLENSINYDYNCGKKEITILNNKDIYYDNAKSQKEIMLIGSLNVGEVSVEEKIQLVKNRQYKYYGNYSGRRIEKTQGKCEGELEYFFIKNIGKNPKIDKIIGAPKNITFWGSQIFCGFGKRRIDVLSITRDNTVNLIELKDDIYNCEFLDQIEKYMRWADQYLRLPGKKLQPVLILNSNTGINIKEIINFNKTPRDYLFKELKIFIWDIENNKVNFEEYKYKTTDN